MGYHQLDNGEHLPFFLAEGRKRLLVSTYACDKALATFLGFPPLISYRFCRIQLPLDLEASEVIAEPAMREASISKLDPNGWNTTGLIKGTSWSRVAVKLGHVRELILELSLGSLDQDVQQSVKYVPS
jgi:chromatin structure-remodeling complex subunit RSC3/30